MNDKCIGLGRFFGHKFEPRFDYSSDQKTDLTAAIKELNSKVLFSDDWVRAVEALCCATSGTIIYVGDVCVRCGEIVRTVKRG